MSHSASTSTPHDSVAKKTVHGGIALGIRQVLVQGSRIVCGIFLARMLTPGQFGIYAIVLYLQSFFTAFGDAGLAASLIRQQEEPEAEDYAAIFTVQQLLVCALSLALWLAAPWAAAKYHLHPADAWLFRLVAISFLITSFMVIPLVRLERHIAFPQVAVIESAQAIVFNVGAVLLAWRGWGGYAFAGALLLRAITGTVLANIISPWRMRWRWDWLRIRSHLAFGVPYQGIQLTSLLKDSVAPIFIGLLLGMAQVGYVTWAMMIAAYPVLVLFVLQRLYMPAFARLQTEPVRLAALVENVLWATNAIAAPLAVLTLVLIVPITNILYGSKWLVALPLFYFFWAANLFVPTATPAMGLLNAFGKSKTSLAYALIWMAGTWLVGAPLIYRYGALGLAVATLVVQFSNFGLYRAAQRLVSFRIYAVITPVWAVAGTCGLLLYWMCLCLPPRHLSGLLVEASAGLLLYAAILYLLNRKKLQTVWRMLLQTR